MDGKLSLEKSVTQQVNTSYERTQQAAPSLSEVLSWLYLPDLTRQNQNTTPHRPRWTPLQPLHPRPNPQYP